MQNKEKMIKKEAKKPYVAPVASVVNVDCSDIVNKSGETPFVPNVKLSDKYRF